MRTNPRCTRIGVSIVFAGIAQATAFAAGESLPSKAYVAVGAEIQSYDYGEALRDQQAWVDGALPCLRVTASRTAGQRDAPDLDWLGSTPEDVLERTGIDVAGERSWEPVLTYELCKDPSGASVRWRTEQDDVSFRFPWSEADPIASVNGISVAVPADYAAQASAVFSGGGDPSALATPPALDALFRRLRSRPDFFRVVGDFERLAVLLGERFDWPAPGPFPATCGFKCSKCGFSLVVLVAGGAAGIIAGCNPVSTGATAGASCVGAIAGTAGATFNAIEACRACDACLHPPDPDQPPPGGGGSGGCADPSGCCPQDYHECCNNQCCSDLNPPSTCQ